MRRIAIEAQNLHYTELNRRIREAVAGGAEEIVLDHVLGQRFIADGLKGTVTLVIRGVPGGDLGMFMSGPTCIVEGNCEHAPGNTMDAGTIVIHGGAGDAVAHSMRGGQVFVRDSIGYRGGIHMKEYEQKRPILVVGGGARAFLGEYMAGGLIVVLGRGSVRPVDERGIGSGIHGGEIYIRGTIDERNLGVGATLKPFGKEQREKIHPCIREYGRRFGVDCTEILQDEFTRIGPSSLRPFANKYVWE
jgi:glutamate synthase (NADPH) GltB3 subunit (EC 1.4.1.13)